MAGIRMYVKLVGGLVALALFLVACNQAAAPGSETLVAQAVGDRYIVVLNEAASADFPGRGRSIAAEVARGYGLQVTHTYGAAIVGFAAQIPAGRLAQLRADPRVKYVETDDPVHIFSQTVPTGVRRIYADHNANIAIDGTDDFRVDVGVAVIDTGIDFEHPDLNVVDGVDCTQSTSGGPPWSRTYTCAAGGDDDHYHGTHVAGTIAAIDNGIGVVGVAPGARLYAVKVLDSSGSGYESMIVAGIDWVTANSDKISVANMSLGGSGWSQAEYDAIQRSMKAGIAYAVAAGNSNDDASKYSPAAFDNVLTVSALADFDGEPGHLMQPTCRTDEDDTLANFSNWGSAVDIAAPGVCILSTYPIEQGEYGVISGTSMASPHAAGALALLASINNPSNAADVAKLYTDVINSGNLSGNDPDNDSGSDNWTEDSGDNSYEPLLDVSNDALFAPVLIAGAGGGATTDDPLSVSVTNPSDGSTVSGVVSVTATASDTDDGVTKVEFFVDGTSIGVDTVSTDGWSASWDTTKVADGPHTASAIATNGASETATDSISVSVDNITEVGDTTVSEIDMSIGRKGPNYEAIATVHGSPVGATIEGTFSISADTSSTISGILDSNGTISFVSSKTKDASATFTIKLTTPSGYECSIDATSTTGVRCMF